MKTNHQRGFVEKTRQFSRYATFVGLATPLDGSVIGAASTLGGMGRHMRNNDRKGAKKFLHSRRRRHDRESIRMLLKIGGTTQ